MKPVIAFFAAPLLPALIPAWFSYKNSTYNPLSAFIFFCGLFYTLQAIIGIPAYKIFTRISQHNVWAYLLLGFCSTALPFLLVALMRSQDHVGELLYLTSYAGLLGACTGMLFWFFARPDKIARQ